MSLITSCPACGTMFRVVPDQLKISEGWVRCGHCAEVFDATAHLADQVPDALRIDDVPTQPGGFVDLPRAWQQTGPSADVPPSALASAPAALRPSRRPLPGQPGFRKGLPEPELLEESSLDQPFVFRRSELIEDDPLSSLPQPLAPPVHPPSRPVELRPTKEALDADPQQMTFVRQARRKAFWRRPMVRLLLTFASLLLAAALVVQLAYQDRDRLALAQPELKPALVQMCELLGCKLAPPRQIEAIVIENSGFGRLRSDSYRLSFTLRNTSPVEVAAPAMELTLTDSQDQPVVRKVLTPADLGLRGDVLPAAGDVSGAVGITVASGGPARIAGYRLLAFYP